MGEDKGTWSGATIQFANDPAPTHAETVEPTDVPTQTGEEQPPPPSLATPAELLRTRGAPSTLYTVSGGDLMALSVAGAGAVANDGTRQAGEAGRIGRL